MVHWLYLSVHSVTLLLRWIDNTGFGIMSVSHTSNQALLRTLIMLNSELRPSFSAQPGLRYVGTLIQCSECYCNLVSTTNSMTAPPCPIDWCHGQFPCLWSPGLCQLLEGGLHHHHQPGLVDSWHLATISVHYHHVQCSLFSETYNNSKNISIPPWV